MLLKVGISQDSLSSAYYNISSIWSRVTCIDVKYENEQVGIAARCVLEKDTKIHELSGFLSVEVGAGVDHVSVLADARNPKQARILVGACRLLNHSCKPNAKVRLLHLFY